MPKKNGKWKIPRIVHGLTKIRCKFQPDFFRCPWSSWNSPNCYPKLRSSDQGTPVFPEEYSSLMQLVREDIHAAFWHSGGMSLIK
jgi:hypothetical protein